MKPLLRAIEILAWVIFFAFAAVVLALRFWVLPDIERFRGDIVAAISRSVGLPVSIGAIEAGWLGLRPQLSFLDVRVYDANGREALVLPAVDNVLSWRSLVYRDLRLYSLAIDGPRLEVRRDPAGALHVAGIRLSGAKGNSRFTDWLLEQREIVVRNAEIEWRDEKRGAPALALSSLQLSLRNSGGVHSIGLSARPPAALGSTLELRAELSGGSVAELVAWNGRTYFELGSTDLAGWRSWIDYPVDLQQGQGALRMWTTFERGEPRQATADVELARVEARLRNDLPPLELASLRGRIEVLSREESYEFAGRQLALTAANGAAMNPADFRVVWRAAGKSGDEHGSVAADPVELEPLAHLAESLPLPTELRKMLAELAPQGRLLDAKLDWSGPFAAPTQFHARTRFADLAARARGEMPGFSGLSGSIDANETKGSVNLTARKAQLDLPRLLAQSPLSLASLNGQIDWERRGERALTVNVASLNFANEDLEGRASGSYSYPGEGQGTIDLTAQLSRVDGRQTARYLPRPGMMSEKTHNWLAAAIVDGRASDVRLRVKGDLRDFPFIDPATGLFQVTARVEKGVLNYANGWPRIQDIDAQLLFERDKMDIVGRSATIFGAKLANVHVSIPSLRPGAHVLASGEAEGPTADFLKYLGSIPVRRTSGGFADAIAASGRGRLRLKLDLPLRELAASKVAGEYELIANTLTVHAQLPPIERVTGTLGFTESSFTVDDVRGRLFGGPIVITGGSRPGLGVEVQVKGDATIASMQPLLNHPWHRFLSGSTAYAATLSVHEGRTRISFESSLRGVSSALPPPLAKEAAEALPLRVEVLPADGGARESISVSLGRLAAAEFLRHRQGDAMAVQRGAIWLSPSAQPIRLPERPGILVYGSLPALDVDRWMAIMSSGEGAATDAAALDLRIGTLDAHGKRLHDLTLLAGTDAAGWSATVKAKEMAGDLSFRNEGGGRLVARLTHFTMPQDYPGAKPQDTGRMKELPSIDLTAERFTYGGKALGRVELVAQRADGDWRIDKLSMVNSDSSLTGRGLWHTGTPSRTSIDFDLEASDAGKLLARVGYPDLVRAGKAKLRGALAWQGDPTTPDYPSLAGDVQLEAENGQFLEIEPGIGKLISLMSLQALPRRLSLDFRDIFSKGFQFDRIASSAHIERGVMALKEFKMRGSAAQIDMSGEVDLAKETQNLRVRVVPSLGDSASTALALLNPLLIFPAAIAQKILKDPLGHIFAFEYAVTGSWTDPKVAKTGVAAQAVEESPNR